MTLMQLEALLPLMLLAGAAVVVMLVSGFWRHHGLTLLLTLAGLVLALWGTVRSAALIDGALTQSLEVTPLLVVDPFSIVLGAVFIGAAMVVALLAGRFFQHHPVGAEEFYVLLLTATLGAVVLAGSRHFASLMIGLELVSLSSFALVAYPLGLARSPEPAAGYGLEAGLKYLLLSAVATAVLLFGMALLYVQYGTLAFAGLREALEPVATVGDALLSMGAALVIAGLAFKLSLVPLHMWTPDVYQGAPTPVTAFIASVSKGAVVAVLLRFLFDTGLTGLTGLWEALAVLAVLSMLVGNLLALTQHDIKRVLAYSAIAHMGYLLVAFIAGAVTAQDNAFPAGLAVEAAVVYLLAYMLTILAAFAVVNAVSDRAQDPAAFELRWYRGLFWRRPLLATVFIAVLLSLAGIPLTVGFIGKFYLFAAGAAGGLWLLLVMVIVGSAIGLYYYLRIVLLMVQHDPAGRRAVEDGTHWPDRWLCYLLLALIVVLGVQPSPVIELLQGF